VQSVSNEYYAGFIKIELFFNSDTLSPDIENLREGLMTHGTVVAICIAPTAGAPMQMLQGVRAIAGHGLEGDRYAQGEGSFNNGRPGNRQVTLLNARFVHGSGFDYADTRRNLIVQGVELMDQIGHQFRIGEAHLRGVKYCDPCMRPTQLASRSTSFRDAFHDCGGLVAEILVGGPIQVGDIITTRHKDY
jgi:hypothetical protein